MDLPLTGWPKDCIPNLLAKVQEIVDDLSIEKFRIGRSVDPDGRKSFYEADDLEFIYETDSIDNSEEVEDVLIKEFFDNPKCLNEAPDARGGTSEEYGPYVYVLKWYLFK